jgi:hypothetical protein
VGLTTELLDEGESSLNLPSTKDVYRDLVRVRQHEGLSISRIEKYGKNLQRLRISQDEFRKSGRQAGTLPAATIKALECAVRIYEPDSQPYKVLYLTMNFLGMPNKLIDRQNKVMEWLGVGSKTTYDGIEKDVYELFAYTIQQQPTSFCSVPSPAEEIAKLPYEIRVITIRLLLEAVFSNRSREVGAAEQLVKALGIDSSAHNMPVFLLVSFALDEVIRGRYRRAIFEYRDRQDNRALFIPSYFFANDVPTPALARLSDSLGASLAKRMELFVQEWLKLRHNDQDPRTEFRSEVMKELGPLSRLALRRAAVPPRGLFYRGKSTTRRFETARRRSLTLLAEQLIAISEANEWNELLLPLLGWSQKSGGQPPPASPPAPKEPTPPSPEPIRPPLDEDAGGPSSFERGQDEW